MAIPKVMGTEIEYGITVKGDPDFDPISSCVLLVNAYREDHAGEILWDYDQENPLADARGFQVDGEKYTPNQQENIARNKTLINGARYYVDHAHPEYSCPEVTTPRDLVVHEKAGERILEASRREANALLPDGTQLLLYKNNSDRKGNSYGAHENFLMDRRTSFKQVVEHLTPFFVTRQVYTGAGKVGSENRSQPCEYQISQRADFFELMRYIEDRGAFGFQLAQGFEQDLDLLRCQNRCGLIHNQQLGILKQAADDLDALALPHGQGVYMAMGM